MYPPPGGHAGRTDKTRAPPDGRAVNPLSLSPAAAAGSSSRELQTALLLPPSPGIKGILHHTQPLLLFPPSILSRSAASVLPSSFPPFCSHTTLLSAFSMHHLPVCPASFSFSAGSSAPPRSAGGSRPPPLPFPRALRYAKSRGRRSCPPHSLLETSTSDVPVRFCKPLRAKVSLWRNLLVPLAVN